jgi:hypothetical protein
MWPIAGSALHTLIASSSIVCTIELIVPIVPPSIVPRSKSTLSTFVMLGRYFLPSLRNDNGTLHLQAVCTAGTLPFTFPTQLHWHLASAGSLYCWDATFYPPYNDACILHLRAVCTAGTLLFTLTTQRQWDLASAVCTAGTLLLPSLHNDNGILHLHAVCTAGTLPRQHRQRKFVSHGSLRHDTRKRKTQ